jgi:hypothetical protein
MWVSVHALSGLAVGTLVPVGIVLTLLCALLLHLLLDLVPHWDYTRHHRRVLWASLDVAFAGAAVIAATLLLDLPARAVLAAAVSALPDLDVFDAVLPGPARHRWFPSHWDRFPHGRARPALGVAVQALVALASVGAVVAASL